MICIFKNVIIDLLSDETSKNTSVLYMHVGKVLFHTVLNERLRDQSSC